MQFTTHNELKMSIFELHHARKPRTELTNLVKDNRNFLSEWTTLDVSVPRKQIPIYAARSQRGEVTDLIVMARKKNVTCCSSHELPKRKPDNENFQYLYTFFRRERSGKVIGRAIKKAKIAINGTENTVCATDNRILNHKLFSTPIKFQRSRNKDMSLTKHQLRGPRGKDVSAGEKTRRVEELIISVSKAKVQKVELDEEVGDLECYHKSDGKPVHVDIDKEVTEREPTLALLPNSSQEGEINNNAETRCGNGYISVRKSSRLVIPPEQLGSVPYSRTQN